MQLNLPIYDRLADCRSILIAGMGGGYDVFCGLPLYLELRAQGKTAFCEVGCSGVQAFRHSGVQVAACGGSFPDSWLPDPSFVLERSEGSRLYAWAEA